MSGGPHARRTAGLVLAGGEGRRWGRPKAWVTLPDGRTFLEACAGLLRAAGVDVVAVTLPPGSAGEVPRGVVPVVLPEPGLDMFASTCLGLARLLEESWSVVAVLPVDHPLVLPSSVAALLAVNAPAVVPTLAGRHGHPVCLAREVAEAVARGMLPGPTLREVLRAAGSQDLEVGDPGIRANCNTPEALACGGRRDAERVPFQVSGSSAPGPTLSPIPIPIPIPKRRP